MPTGPPAPPGRRWGSVARKGVRVLSEGPDQRDRAKEPPWTPAGGRATRRQRDEVWVLDEVVESGSRPTRTSRTTPTPRAGIQSGTDRVRRSAPRVDPSGDTRTPRRAALPPDVVDEIGVSAEREQVARVAERLAAAASAYERDRYQDALRMTRSVIAMVPRSASALELHGLVCYRLGRWRDALRYLVSAAELVGADESQIPVLMDCHRALRHNKKVRTLWKELRASSPPADVLVEGRLVLAAMLRDEGKLDEAIAELTGAGAARALAHPSDRHIRQWYLLADLYDRAGDIPRAREFFARVVEADPELADAAERLAGLGRPGRRKAPGRGPPRPLTPAR